MGRDASVTYEGICKASEELLAQGIKPSVRAIRALVGGGSMKTINVLLRQWREKQASDDAAAPACSHQGCSR